MDMKKSICLISFLFLFHINIYCDELFGYINVIYSYELNEEKKIHNFSLGQELMLFSSLSHIFGVNSFGLKYKFINNTISLYYTASLISLPFINMGDLLYPPLLGIGTDLSYNIKNNIYGIGPQIDFMIFMIYGLIKFNITYRYNIYIRAKNTHEFEFKLSICDFHKGNL
jgi:hypothetical protein